MKIAIAATSSEIDAQVEILGARAPYYLLFNERGELLEALVNPFLKIDRGVAPQMVSFLADKEVALLAAGEFGVRFASELEQRGIKYIQKSGLVSDVIRELVT